MWVWFNPRMAKPFTTWTVLPHDPREQLDDNLWYVRGKLPDGDGHRVMTVARRRDGRLVVHNAIALEPALMAELEAFGEPAFLVVPNGFHRLDARIWKDRYPAMRVLCPRGARKAVAKVVPVDGAYNDMPPDEDVQLTHLEGLKEREGVMLVRGRAGASLVVNDVIMNMPKLTGVMGVMLGPTGRPAIPRVMRWFMVADRRALRGHLERLAATPDLRRVIVSHGAPLADDPGATLRGVAAQLN